MNSTEDIQKQHKIAYDTAIRKLKRLRETKDVPNITAFEILCAHYINGVPKEDLILKHVPVGRDPTQVRKLLAKNEGKDSSRRGAVRRIFFAYAEALGVKTDVNLEEKKEETTAPTAPKRPGVRSLLDMLESSNPPPEPAG